MATASSTTMTLSSCSGPPKPFDLIIMVGAADGSEIPPRSAPLLYSSQISRTPPPRASLTPTTAFFPSILHITQSNLQGGQASSSFQFPQASDKKTG